MTRPYTPYDVPSDTGIEAMVSFCDVVDYLNQVAALEAAVLWDVYTEQVSINTMRLVNAIRTVSSNDIVLMLAGWNDVGYPSQPDFRGVFTTSVRKFKKSQKVLAGE